MNSTAHTIFPAGITDRFRKTGVIAVLVIDDVASAVPLAKLLVNAGIDIMELTLRTPSAFDALGRIVKEVPEMLAGVGTVLSPAQVRQAQDAGASFIVTPGTNRKVIEEALKVDMPIGPGVATPSDIETALEYGCRIMKFFPAEPQGGLPYLRAMNAPYAHLGIEYIPLGGVSETNCGGYIKERSIIAVGGSWIAPRDSIRACDWAGIRTRAEAAARLCGREAVNA